MCQNWRSATLLGDRVLNQFQSSSTAVATQSTTVRLICSEKVYVTTVVRTWRWDPSLPKLQPVSNRIMLHQSRCRPVLWPQGRECHPGIAKELSLPPAHRAW